MYRLVSQSVFPYSPRACRLLISAVESSRLRNSRPPFFFTRLPTYRQERTRVCFGESQEGGKAGPAGVASPLLVVGVGERRPPAFINSSFGFWVFSLRWVVVGVKADYFSWRGWYRQSHRQSMTAPPLCPQHCGPFTVYGRPGSRLLWINRSTGLLSLPLSPLADDGAYAYRIPPSPC